MRKNPPKLIARTPLSSETMDPTRRRPQGRSAGEAFTRLELVVILGALALLAAVALPALANTKARAERAACVNNLSRIGQAFDSWAAAHGDLYPMQVPYSGSDGGLHNHPSGLQGNAYIHFAWVSNDLRTPKILVCPSDPIKRTASGWGFNSDGGFVYPNYQNQAVSYIVAHPLLELGRGILSGDRNIRGSQYEGGCVYGISPMFAIRLPATNAAWGPDIHENTGNLLFNDGSVEQTDNTRLRNSMTSHPVEGQTFHFMAP